MMKSPKIDQAKEHIQPLLEQAKEHIQPLLEQAKDLVFKHVIAPNFKNQIEKNSQKKESNQPQNTASQNTTHPNISTSQNTASQHQNQQVLDALFLHFEDLKNKELPNYIAYYLHIQGLKKNLNDDVMDILYQKYGKKQLKPNLQADMIAGGYSMIQAKPALLEWIKRFGISASPKHGLIYHMDLLLKELTHQEIEKIFKSMGID